MTTEKMSSRELGLVLAQQLLGVDDLHYGLWDEDLELKFANIGIAQQRYTDQILNALPPAVDGGVRVVDIGCGTGHILAQMLDRGYQADAVSPAPELSKRVQERLAQRPGNTARLFECKFEDFPVEERTGYYDAALFSESFQYISLEHSLPRLQRILKPGGRVVICDFFKTEHAGDGRPGDRSFGGGHAMSEFYEKIKDSAFEIEHDEDITKKVSPNLKLLNDLLMDKLKPAGSTLDRYLRDNKPFIAWLIRTFFRKKLDKLNYKYFSGHRSPEVFERYKTYHLIVLRLES